MLFSPQIPLPLQPGRVGGLNDFVEGPNGAVLDAVRSLVNQSDHSIFLHGPAGSGKSHLLNGACMAAREKGGSAFYLGLEGLSEQAVESLRGLEQMNLVCLDGLEHVTGNAVWEEGLFHFINRLRQTRGNLLVAARQRLRELPIGLPDLASRLAWGLRLELQPLDDADKAVLMQRYAGSLGIELPDEVLSFLQRRGPRNTVKLLGIVKQLQDTAFRDKRPITVPLTRQLLER